MQYAPVPTIEDNLRISILLFRRHGLTTQRVVPTLNFQSTPLATYAQFLPVTSSSAFIALFLFRTDIRF